MAITLSGDGITSDNIISLAATKLTGTVPDANAPSGSIVQVPAQAITFTQINTTTTTFTDWPGMSVSITPSSASNRILIIAVLNGLYTDNSHNPLMRLLRNSTVIAVGGDYQPYNNAGVAGGCQNIVFIDSPSTTSSVTYKIQYKSDSGGFMILNVNDSSGAQLNDESTNSTLTLMEIAA